MSFRPGALSPTASFKRTPYYIRVRIFIRKILSRMDLIGVKMSDRRQIPPGYVSGFEGERITSSGDISLTRRLVDLPACVHLSPDLSRPFSSSERDSPSRLSLSETRHPWRRVRTMIYGFKAASSRSRSRRILDLPSSSGKNCSAVPAGVGTRGWSLLLPVAREK